MQTARTYRRKAKTVVAMRFNGMPDDCTAVEQFIGKGVLAKTFRHEGVIRFQVFLDTLVGKATLNPGDWVVRGLDDSIVTMTNDIFEAEYEQVP